MKSKNKKKEVDYLEEVMYAVSQYDQERLKNGPNKEKLHEKAVKMIELCNKERGKGYINISKTRKLNKLREKRL